MLLGRGYILSLDQSTSGSKAMVIDRNGCILAKESMEHRQFYPCPGWVEHDPQEIYENVRKVLRKAVDKSEISSGDIDVLAVTNQRETVVVWDKTTGKPLYNAIVWQCRRTSKICEEYKQAGMEGIVKEKTGLLLDPYFSATKVKWILDNVDGAREKAENGTLLMGTVDTWIIWNLTKGKVHATDYTNASRTLMLNIRTLKWDKWLLDLFDIPSSMLGEIKSSNDIFGSTEPGELFDISLPISGVIGDSQGALFGQKCFEPGMIKATYGTGSSVLMNIGDSPVEAREGLVTSIAWGIDGRVEYALEGIIHCTGDALKWVKDNLGLFSNFQDAESMAASLDGNEGVYMVPAFVGLGIPYWDSNARAAIVGMSRGSRREHIIRAATESIAYQVKDAIDKMEEVSGIHPVELRADGGATSNSFLMQFQADIINIMVTKNEVAELSAMGSAYLAGIAAGLFKNKIHIRELRKEERCFIPNMNEYEREKCYKGWTESVKKVLTNCKEGNYE